MVCQSNKPFRANVVIFNLMRCYAASFFLFSPMVFAAESSCCTVHNEVNALLLCALAGAFGGLLYSAKDNKLSLPGYQESGSYHLGWIADILFGIAGGIVIFMLYPGDINLLDENVSGLIKFAGLGIVGGYGGRLFLEKATSARLAGVEEQVEAIKNKDKTDADAKAAIERILDENPEGDQLSDKELTALLKNASHSVQVDAFMAARAFRKKMTAIIFDNISDDVDKQVAKTGLRQVLKVLNALAELDEARQYHRTYGQLAYCYRTLGEYGKSLESFNEAIKIRDKRQVDGYKYYEFGRAACKAIQSPEDKQGILDDLGVSVKADGTAAQRMKPLDKGYEKELYDWFANNANELKAFKQAHGFDPIRGGVI